MFSQHNHSSSTQEQSSIPRRQALSQKNLPLGEQLEFILQGNLESAMHTIPEESLSSRMKEPSLKKTSLVIEKFAYPKTSSERISESERLPLVTAPWPDSHPESEPLEVDMRRTLEQFAQGGGLDQDHRETKPVARRPDFDAETGWSKPSEKKDSFYSLGPIHKIEKEMALEKDLFSLGDDFLDKKNNSTLSQIKQDPMFPDDALLSGSIQKEERLPNIKEPPVPREKTNVRTKESVLRFPKKVAFWENGTPRDDSFKNDESREGQSRNQRFVDSQPYFSTSVAPLLFFLSVPLISFLFLWEWSHSLISTPHAISQALHLPPIDSAHVSPPELEVKNITSELVTLDNGKQALEIKGIVLNNTEDLLRDIKIEARVFDKENRLLKGIVVDTFNGLVNAAHINSLSEEIIDSLQQKLALGERQLKPSEQASFRVVVTQPTEEATWFTARVYSVRS